jgi:hypothetical protein
MGKRAMVRSYMDIDPSGRRQNVKPSLKKTM